MDYELNDTDLTADAGAGAESGPLYVACYGDGPDSSTTDIDGWTTDADDWIDEKAEIIRRLFQELSLLLHRLGYLENKGITQ